jgi:hypothetical protein
LAVGVVDVPESLGAGLPLELLLLRQPLLQPLRLRRLRLGLGRLLAHRPLHHLSQVLVLPPLHVVLEVFEEFFVMFFPLNFLLAVLLT